MACRAHRRVLPSAQNTDKEAEIATEAIKNRDSHACLREASRTRTSQSPQSVPLWSPPVYSALTVRGVGETLQHKLLCSDESAARVGEAGPTGGAPWASL